MLLFLTLWPCPSGNLYSNLFQFLLKLQIFTQKIADFLKFYGGVFNVWEYVTICVFILFFRYLCGSRTHGVFLYQGQEDCKQHL
jgi:hypothetical protein